MQFCDILIHLVTLCLEALYECQRFKSKGNKATESPKEPKEDERKTKEK